MSKRYLGIDYGGKRIGLALGDAEGGIVSPLRVLSAGADLDADVRAIAEAADEYGVDGIVIGLPLNMDGTEGPQAKLCRRLAESTAAETGIEVELHDERLTSHAADQRLSSRDLTRKGKKQRQDAIAAQIMLESFLASR